MSRYYGVAPIDLSGLKTIKLAERGGKVKQADFARVYEKGSGVAGLIESLPHILAGDTLRAVVDAIAAARAKQKADYLGHGRARDQVRHGAGTDRSDAARVCGGVRHERVGGDS